MKYVLTLFLSIFSLNASGQYFHYLHTYDTTAEGNRNILLQTDGSLLVTGAYLNLNNYHEDACWFHFSSQGETILNKQYLHTNGCAYYINHSGNAKKIVSGGYIVPYTCYAYSADPDRYQNMATLVFLNNQLDTTAIKRYTDTSLYSETLYDCDILPDGGYLIGGSQESSFISQQTVPKGMVIRVDEQGNMLWKKTYQKQPGKGCFMHSIQPLDNNRSLVGGASRDVVPLGTSYYYRYKPWFVIIDNSDGNVLKDTLYGSEYGYSGTIYKDINGGYYHTGRKDSIVTTNYYDAVNFPAYIAHLDSNFKIEWITTLSHGYQPYQKSAWRVRQLQNGDFMVCGTGLPDTPNFMRGWVARFSNSGAILWSKYYYSQTNKNAYLTDFVERPDDNIILCGWTSNDTVAAWHGQELWLLGLYASGEVLTGTAFTGNASVRTMEFSIYPNPTSGSFYLEVPEPGQAELYDMSGKQVATYTVPKGKTQLLLDDKIAAGNYLLQFAGKESGMVAGKQLIVNSR